MKKTISIKEGLKNSTKTYYEKLKDPRWQKIRLQIMQRDNFMCVICGAKHKPLNVHHRLYFKNWEPWDYNDHHLITLCEDCHQNIDWNNLKNDLLDYLYYIGINENHIFNLTGDLVIKGIESERRKAVKSLIKLLNTLK